MCLPLQLHELQTEQFLILASSGGAPENVDALDMSVMPRMRYGQRHYRDPRGGCGPFYKICTPTEEPIQILG